MKLSAKPERRPPENTIPLINVVFLMLIFFLFAGSIARDDARRVEPPIDMVEDEVIRSTDALVIDRGGELYSRGEPVELESWVAVAKTADGPMAPGMPIKIAADGDLPADRLEEIMKQLKQDGLEDIVLITRRGTGQ